MKASRLLSAVHRAADAPCAAPLLAALVALVPRLGFVLVAGGLRGTYDYDSSVYYAAADALLHGRLPYRDFVLLHPPGIALVVSPFAAVGTLTSDHVGFIAGNLAFTLLGALNAALVVRVAARFGLGRGPALVGGLCYAVWPGAVGAEYLIRLEPLGNLLLLLALLAAARAAAAPRGRWPVLCGVALGAAVAVKIWNVVPLLVLLGWQLRDPARRPGAPRLLAGAAGAAVLIAGPFFALAPRQMWSMVIVDQLVRSPIAPLPDRLTGLSGFRQLDAGFAASQPGLVIAISVLLLALLCAAAARHPGGGLFAALLLVQVALLSAAPSWFPFYDDFLAPALALTAAAATARAARSLAGRPATTRRRLLRVGAALAVTAASATLLVAAAVLPPPGVHRYPGGPLAEAVEGDRCVMADSPMALIELDVLTSDLRNGCPEWVDVTGRTYGPDAPRTAADGRPVPRVLNARWQRDLTRYLLAGDAVTLLRPDATGIGSKLWATLRREPVLVRVGGFAVLATHRPTDRIAAH